MNLNSRTSKDALEYSENLKDLPVTKYIKNRKKLEMSFVLKMFSCWNITKVIMHLARKEENQKYCLL